MKGRGAMEWMDGWWAEGMDAGRMQGWIHGWTRRIRLRYLEPLNKGGLPYLEVDWTNVSNKRKVKIIKSFCVSL